MTQRFFFLGSLIIAGLFAVTGCTISTSDDDDETDDTAADAQAEPAATQANPGRGARGAGRLSGTLYFESNEPLEAVQVMAMNMRTRTITVAANGSEPSIWKDDLAFFELCSPLYARMSITDSDGFVNAISACFEIDFITPDVFAPKISPNGERLVMTNTAIPTKETSDDPLRQLTLSFEAYAATQVFDRDGNLIAEFENMGPATWTRDNRLILAGMGRGDDQNDGEGPGIYRASRDLKSVERVDDGRLNAGIVALDAHPRRDRIAFIFNSQLWEMDLDDGAPSRIHSPGYPMAGLAYSPTGDHIAYVSTDPLEEALRSDSPYRIWIYTDGDVSPVDVPFVPGAQLDWTE